MYKKENYWSDFAEEFEQNNTYVVGKNDMKIVLDTVHNLKHLNKTLELGCGNGTYSKIIAKNATQLTATDYSEQMVTITKDRLIQENNTIVEIANCFNLNYSKESFDTVFMANLLHIIDQPKAAILQAEQCLNKKGQLIILDFGMEGMTILNKLKLIYRYRKTYGRPPKSRQKLTLNSIKSMLIDSNFEIKRSELIGDKMKCAFIIAQKR